MQADQKPGHRLPTEQEVAQAIIARAEKDGVDFSRVDASAAFEEIYHRGEDGALTGRSTVTGIGVWGTFNFDMDWPSADSVPPGGEGAS